MINASNFEFLSYQAVVFTPELQLSLNRILPTLIGEFSDKFNSDPVIIQLPPDVPREIPRMILKNQDESWKAQFSSTRLDVIWSRNYLRNDVLDSNEFLEYANKIFDSYRNLTRTRYGRLAFIINRVQESSNPGRELATHFCKQQWLESKALNRPENFEIHAFKRYKVNEEIGEVNSWIRHKTVKVKTDMTDIADGILVEQDINTPQERSESFDYEEIRKIFFRTASDEMQKIITLYYT